MATVLVPLLAVSLAGVFAFWKQKVSMKAARRDRLRLAYSTWLNAFDFYQRALPAVRFAPPPEPASVDEQAALESALRDEAAAFTYLLLLDPDEGRIARASDVRTRDCHDKDRIRNAEGTNLHERSSRVQMEDEKALHEYARQLCKELKETV